MEPIKGIVDLSKKSHIEIEVVDIRNFDESAGNRLQYLCKDAKGTKHWVDRNKVQLEN